MKVKTVLVTGATRGLGLAIAARLQREGYRVIATVRKETAEINQLCTHREADMGEVFFCPFDLSRTDLIHEFVRSVTGQYGPLYGLVNNAALGLDGVLATMHDSQIAQLIEVNVLSAILMTKYASRSMLMQGCGRIVNISSIISFTGFNGLSVYAATKSAMMGFTRSLARELGKAGVTVNAIAPGYMETAMTGGLRADQLESIRRRSPSARLTTVEDVAGGVFFLLSDDARSITGTTLTIDAGSTA